MAVINESYEMVSLGQVKCHPRNARHGDVGAISDSIDHNGFFGALVVQKSTGYILAGNHRYLAAKAQNMSQVPVLWVDVDDQQALKILLADNRTNDLASYDDTRLAELLAELSNSVGLDGTGYSSDDLDELIGGLADNSAMAQEAPEPQLDKAEELREKWGVEYGQLWEVGRHRILCGDSTKPDDVGRLMDGKKVDAMVTDPPYGLGDTKSDKNNYIEHVDSSDNLKKIIAAFLPIYSKYVERTVITPGNGNQHLYPASSWVMAWFTPAGIGRGPWGFCCWQPILCYGKDPRLAKGQGCHPDALVHTESSEKNGHPCPKPVNFWKWLVQRASVDDGSIVDPFLGSGTTSVVCEELGRDSFGMEMSPAYVAVTLQRLADMGLEPRLIDASRTTDKANG